MPNAKILSEKQAIVADLTEKFQNAAAGVIVDYRGITVAEDTELRAQMRANGVEYFVVKNTLARFAAKNAGLEGSVIIDKIVSANKPNYGFDAQNEVFVDDMIAAGIVDPTKVTRSALENAASVAEMVLTTESLVADLPEPPAAPAAAGGDMGGMGGMY